MIAHHRQKAAVTGELPQGLNPRRRQKC